jgi:DNA-binding IclR family transcriptional regulator
VGRVDDKALQLLKAMREQLGKTSAGRSVDAVAAANSLGMDRSTLVHRRLHDLVRADYLEEPANPALRAEGKYLITFEGIAAADNY